MARSYSQLYPWTLHLIKNVEDIVVILLVKKCLIVIITFPAVEMFKSLLKRNQNNQCPYLKKKWYQFILEIRLTVYLMYSKLSVLGQTFISSHNHWPKMDRGPYNSQNRWFSRSQNNFFPQLKNIFQISQTHLPQI